MCLCLEVGDGEKWGCFVWEIIKTFLGCCPKATRSRLDCPYLIKKNWIKSRMGGGEGTYADWVTMEKKILTAGKKKKV